MNEKPEKQTNEESQNKIIDDTFNTPNRLRGIPIFSPSIEPIHSVESTVITESTKRTSTKQRKESLEEYKETFLKAPKIIDRQPVFISRELRDKIDELVRRIGERKMSVSGFIENVIRHHLETYKDDIERWKRL